MNRRAFLGSIAAVPAVGLIGPPQRPVTAVFPRRLAPGDTVGLVAPASATFQTVDVAIARESLEGLGLKVKIGEHVLSRHGYLSGADKDRAADINRFFRDDDVRAVLPIRGGWGSSRVLPYLDFDVIRDNPKVVLGYSDITALHLAIHAKTGLVTFHGPNGMGRWDEWSVDSDHIIPLDVPAWSGAMIGHQTPQWTVPVGAEAEIDADRGAIRLLAPAVR